MKFNRQYVQVWTDGVTQEGCLLFGDGALIAVFVCLSVTDAPDLVGKWFLEAGFGKAAEHNHPIFDHLDAAERWVSQI